LADIVDGAYTEPVLELHRCVSWRRKTLALCHSRSEKWWRS